MVENKGRIGALEEMAGKRRQPIAGGRDLPDWISSPLTTTRHERHSTH